MNKNLNNKLVSIPVVGKCVTRNGETDIGLMTSIVNADGVVRIGFVSSKLHRSLNAGAKIRASDLDSFCKEWLKIRMPPDCGDGPGHALNDESKSVMPSYNDLSPFLMGDEHDAGDLSKHALNDLVSRADDDNLGELMKEAFKQALFWLDLVKTYMYNMYK